MCARVTASVCRCVYVSVAAYVSTTCTQWTIDNTQTFEREKATRSKEKKKIATGKREAAREVTIRRLFTLNHITPLNMSRAMDHGSNVQSDDDADNIRGDNVHIAGLPFYDINHEARLELLQCVRGAHYANAKIENIPERVTVYHSYFVNKLVFKCGSANGTYSNLVIDDITFCYEKFV